MKQFLFTLPLLILASCSKQPIDITQSNVFTFGSSVEQMQHQLQNTCDNLTVKEITPITAPLALKSQFQINCSGFIYAGKKRNVELVFQDDQLDLVWILFPVNEKPEIINAFKNKFGEPSMVIDYGSIYLDINAAIRNVPPEVLFVSDRHEQVMLKMLSAQTEQ